MQMKGKGILKTRENTKLAAEPAQTLWTGVAFLITVSESCIPYLHTPKWKETHVYKLHAQQFLGMTLASFTALVGQVMEEGRKELGVGLDAAPEEERKSKKEETLVMG